jgi:hypothetical protein
MHTAERLLAESDREFDRELRSRENPPPAAASGAVT